MQKILIFSISLLLFISCEKKKQEKKLDEVIKTLETGTWKISYFFYNGTDETNLAKDYIFTFSGGKIKGVRINYIVDGIYERSTEKTKIGQLYVGFGSTMNFEDFHNFYEIEEHSSSKIKLSSVPGSNKLHFEKL